MALILDTGPLFASLDRRDGAHEASSAMILSTGERLVIPGPVLVEIDYLLVREQRSDIFGLLLGDIVSGVYHVEDLEPADYVRVSELCERYADSDIGFVDAAVLAIVERLGEPKLATLDRRHFGVMRPRHVEALELLPA